ncbi:VWA domain-containing protein, partial [bacterium]|nr:VWA domain-containing protein [bacterium]
MTLLAPLMLLGLVGLALPTIVHLIAKHRFPVREFPSIRLLRYERRANVFSWRLVDGKQLLLRLLVLLLLVLAMARLFFPWASHGPAPRNLVVVLDGSGSMQARVKDPLDGSTTTLFALATEQARTLLADVEAPSRCALLLAGAENRWLAPLTTSPAAAVESLATTKASDGTGPGLVTAVLEACQLVQNRREVRSQVVVFTDLAATAFSARSPQDMAALRAIQASMGESVEILFIDLSLQDRDNLAITSASVQNKELIVGSDLHVMSTVRNFSGEEKAVKLRLEVGGRKEKAVREIALPAGGEAHVDLT